MEEENNSADSRIVLDIEKVMQLLNVDANKFDLKRGGKESGNIPLSNENGLDINKKHAG